jgi:zinc-ribbon domain
MDNQPQQRFCTNCGQPLTPGAAFCVSCGTQASASPAAAPVPFPAGAQPGYPPPYAQAPTQGEDDPLLAVLAAASLASRMRRTPLGQPRPRRRRSRLRGCGCLLLILAIIAGPFIGAALTHGKLQQTFVYVAIGIVAFFFLLVVIGMLTTRRGRETLAEGCGEGCLDALLGGFLGGG